VWLDNNTKYFLHTWEKLSPQHVQQIYTLRENRRLAYEEAQRRQQEQKERRKAEKSKSKFLGLF